MSSHKICEINAERKKNDAPPDEAHIDKFEIKGYNINITNVNYPKRGVFMKAVVTVIGRDTVGILAKVSSVCAEYNANIIEVTQSVLQDMFAMIMLIDISNLSKKFTEFSDKMADLGDEMGLKIHAMHEDIFNAMHKI